MQLGYFGISLYIFLKINFSELGHFGNKLFIFINFIRIEARVEKIIIM